MPGDEPNSGRLSRWSQRKLATRHQKADDADPAEAEHELTKKEEELLANREAAEAVDLAALDSTSDFSIFLKEGVPDLLKRKALATLWKSNPILANVDGLVDYDDDFGNPELNMKVFKSAYQAGRGYLEHIERQAEALAGKIETDDDENETAEAFTSDPDKVTGTEENADDPVSAEPEEAEETASDEPPDGPEEDAEMARVSLRQRLELERSG